MVTTSRARLLMLCALLSLPPLGGALADPPIKPAIVGLISTGSMTNTLKWLRQYEGTFGGLVVQVTWADLQPTGASDFDTSKIDKFLTNQVSKYNAKVATMPAPNNRQIGVRLRVFAGCSAGQSDAPTWAMKLDTGFPIAITAEYNDYPETCTVGKFWDRTSNYAAAWRQLQIKLANAYDTNPLIQEVAVTSCTSFSAEPFFLNLKPPVYTQKYPAPNPLPPSPTSALQNAGYSDAAYRHCLAQAVPKDYAPWKRTRLEFSFNPFYGVNQPQGDVAFSGRAMRGCRQAAGLRCILSNHDLDADTPDGILPIYALERKFGPNITFQALHVVPNDFEGTLRKGISLGAGSIEIWQEPAAGSFENQSKTTLTNWASMFEPQ